MSFYDDFVWYRCPRCGARDCNCVELLEIEANRKTIEVLVRHLRVSNELLKRALIMAFTFWVALVIAVVVLITGAP